MRSIWFLLWLTMIANASHAQKGFSLIDKPLAKKVEIRYDGKLLTAYCYFDSTEKPVLYPIKTLSGVTVTRGYPVAPRQGERTDHPHHLGLWMNYESVNGFDFWNNSTAIAAEKKPHYGSIHHQKVLASESKKDKAKLETLSHWVDPEGNVLLEETTLFVFSKKENNFIIDRISTLVAKVDQVMFKDVKDGMLAIRVSRQLELPSKENSKYVDAHGNVTTVPPSENAQVTGMYVNEEGVTGDDVWGKRSRWTCLNGVQDGEKVSIAIIDHPENPGYPTYWHARGYGLFAANPLGQKVFSEGKEELNLSLKNGEKVSFKYRIIIHSGSTITSDELNQQAVDFAKTNH
jgi:Methane oxygenase PmoA